MPERKLMSIVVLAVLALGGCKKEKEQKPEELTIVVEADRSKIARQEAELRERFEQLRAERERLRKEREKLFAGLKGKMGRDQLELLRKREQQMLQRERELEKQRQQLTQQVNQLLGRLGGGKPAPAAAASGADADIAARERAIAKREAELARREAELARREAELARREAEFLKTKAALASVRIPAKPRVGRSASTKEIRKVYRKALARMKKNGILRSDLPLEDAGLFDEIEKALKEGKTESAIALVNRLDAIVRATRVDAGFIERKLQRLSELRSRKKLSAEASKNVSKLFRAATRFYSDGKYALANKQLNRIHAILAR